MSTEFRAGLSASAELLVISSRFDSSVELLSAWMVPAVQLALVQLAGLQPACLARRGPFVQSSPTTANVDVGNYP